MKTKSREELKQKLYETIKNDTGSDELNEELAKLLTEYVPFAGYDWEFSDKSLSIKIPPRLTDRIMDFIETLVGCSYFTNVDDGLIKFEFTASTLIKKILSNHKYDTIKIDRFVKYESDRNHNGVKSVSIVDNKLLADNYDDRFDCDGVIFIAATNSNWVNHDIADKILELLNTDPSYCDFMDEWNRK